MCTHTQLLPQHMPHFEPVFRLMAQILVTLTSDMIMDTGFAGESVADAFFEVLGKLLCKQPTVMAALVPDAAAQTRLVERWLRLAMQRSLQELLRLPGVVAVGRFRRHLAACALCAMVAADASPALQDPTMVCVEWCGWMWGGVTCVL